jgi:Tol biopolymer transport system component
LAFFGNLSAKDYDLAIKPPPEGRDVVTRIEGTHELNPTWSPDGQTLALVQRVGQSATSDIYLFDIRTQKLSGPYPADPGKRGGQDGNPVWSRDGSQIAFYKKSETGYHIWLMNRDGTGACDLMPNRPGNNLDPNWR